MPKGVVEEGSEWSYEEGEATVRLRDVKEESKGFTYNASHKAVQNGKANVGETGTFTQWLWKFEYLDGANSGKGITIRTDPGVKQKGWSPARQMFEALRNAPVEVGEDVDTDDVIGLCAKAVTVNYTENDRRDASKVYYRSRLQDFYPSDEPAESGAWTNSSSYPDEPPF